MLRLHGFLHDIEWIMFYGHLDYFQKSPIGGRPTQNQETMALRMFTTIFFILFYHVLEPAESERHWNSIWLRAQLDMASQYTWDSMTTLHDFGGILERPLGTFFWALTISWSQLLARVWSGPKSGLLKKTSLGYLWEIKPTCDFARLEVGGFVTRLV